MKNIKETEKIHTTEQPEKPKDIEELRKELLSNEISDSEIINVGLNRNQFFIRLPTRMTDTLNLTKEDKMRITLSGTEGNFKITLEVVKGGKT